MKIDKVKSIVRRNLKNYSSYETIIDDLIKSKEKGTKKDVNSFIKSKNSISRSTEIQAIRNVNIDNKILEIKEWKKIIDFVLEESKSEYEYKGKAMTYKYVNNISNDMIVDILNVSPSGLKNWVNEFILEVGIIAIERKIIKVERL